MPRVILESFTVLGGRIQWLSSAHVHTLAATGRKRERLPLSPPEREIGLALPPSWDQAAAGRVQHYRCPLTAAWVPLTHVL